MKKPRQDHELFKIYVDRLRFGQEVEIEGEVSPNFLDIHEKDLVFKDPVTIKGKAYLADENLVMQLALRTKCYLPCAICGELTEVPLNVENFYHIVPLSEIKGRIFDLSEVLREEILLEVPSFVECHDNACPMRDEIKRFLKKEDHESP